jgi:hypothetical protein
MHDGRERGIRKREFGGVNHENSFLFAESLRKLFLLSIS